MRAFTYRYPRIRRLVRPEWIYPQGFPTQWTSNPVTGIWCRAVSHWQFPKDTKGKYARVQVTVLNAPGTIDSDFRGEVQVLLINHGRDTFVVKPGMRIAQLVVSPVSQVAWDTVTVLPKTDRDDGGFGHTGT